VADEGTQSIQGRRYRLTRSDARSQTIRSINFHSSARCVPQLQLQFHSCGTAPEAQKHSQPIVEDIHKTNAKELLILLYR